MEATSSSELTSEGTPSPSLVPDLTSFQVRFDVDNPRAWEARARVLQRLGRTQEAIASLQHALQLTQAQPEN